ncbi:NB-ARC domain-containing protein [Clostridium estertheticum]|uniref:NB-ARC domain-containing protein n=1 Tax=Clostridium estertheticum TaxID=238834 RepID=UPI001CF17E20|nr:NB-ARC domain-containing protein [Clostridium estertheticum]MCB2357605.1 hypothetical protein [Clostridium estertheticum]
MDVELDCEFLSLENLADMEDYDYYVLCAHTIKDKIFVECEDLNSKLVSIKEAEETIYSNKLKLIILISNNYIDNCSVLDDIPLVVIKSTQNNINNLLFRIFRRGDIKCTMDDYQGFNIEKCKLNIIAKGTAIINYNNTKLSDQIDKQSIVGFIGREMDLQSLSNLILKLKNNGRILNIKGSGGLGKTTIIQKLAYEYSKRNYFKDGIDFFSCENIDNYDLFENKIAQCFSLDNSINLNEHIKQNNIIMDKLILIDNFETILYIDEVEKVKDLVKFISNYCTIVMTSRETVYNEYFEDIYPLRDLSTDEALDLFKDSYRYNLSECELKVLREEIIENLLNKNPLAIKIVANNIPQGKGMSSLKNELEENFFSNTITEHSINMFKDEYNGNIEKSKSMFHCINYSYKRLSHLEKVCFELLSIFPNGINIENFKLFYKYSIKDSMLDPITDKELRSLENKSLVYTRNKKVILQSIIRRFAELQFNIKSDNEKRKFFKQAFKYNYFMIINLMKSCKYKLSSKECEVVDDMMDNAIKVLTYIDKFNDKDTTKYGKLKYISTLGICCMEANYLEKFLENLYPLEKFFNGEIELFDTFNIIKLQYEYFYGKFEKAFSDIEKIVTLEKDDVLKLPNNIIRAQYLESICIFVFEGKAFSVAKLIISINDTDTGLLDLFCLSMFQLGKYSKVPMHKFEKSFFYYDIGLNSRDLNMDEFDLYISKIYNKNHLEIMQTKYIKAKLGLINREEINNLVEVNSYTSGLKKLMYAFLETDKQKAIQYYSNAIKNLVHIKYYYIEAIYFFSKYLKDIEDIDYRKWAIKGYKLSKEFYYGFQIHRFEQILNLTEEEFYEDNYKLPEELELNRYISKLT